MAVPTDAELKALLDRFVCVRMVQMYGIDLERFQFDYAMTWSVFFMNADGTIYGRYGTRSATRKQSARDISLAGFKRSIEGALEIDERYRKDSKTTRDELHGKQSQHKPKWPRAELIPMLQKNPLLAKRFTGHSENRNFRAHGVGCIHCHMVPNHELISRRTAGEPIAERLIWPYPQPGAVGLRLDPQKRATVRRVIPDSAADKAGIQPGDEIAKLGGQTILSPADFQWVLHNAPSPAKLEVALRRGEKSHETTLDLGAAWRRRLGDWRFTNLNLCMRVAGFQGRPNRNGGQRLAIRVGRVHFKRLANVDLKKNDIIVAIDGKRAPMNLGKLTQYLLSKKPGSEITVSRLRPGQDQEKTVRWKTN